MISFKGYSDKIYTFLICVMGLAMPNLNLLMSMTTIGLVVYWLYDPGIKDGFRRLATNRIAMLLVGVLVLHLIWLINTENIENAFKDIRIKAPLLAFALVLGTIDLSKRQVRLFFFYLSVGILIATSIAYYNYFHLDKGLNDPRSIVREISHIRLSLFMVATTAAILFYWKDFGLYEKIYGIFVWVNTIVFFQVLQSFTGIAGLILICLVFLFYQLNFQSKLAKITLVSGALLMIIGTIYLYQYYNNYFTPKERFEDLDEFTVNGNPYYHQEDVRLVENGYYIFMNVCEPELVSAWNERSNLKLESTYEDSDLRARLGRYLTSKGYRKDSLGVSQLTDQDILNIENGYPSCVYAEKSGLLLRIHGFLFTYHVYKETGYASGYSLFQRLIYWKVAANIISDNFWFGVGTGDLKDAYQSQYEKQDYDLDPKYWLRAHNQFLTIFVATGVFGFAYFVFFFIAAIKANRYSYLPLAITLLVMLSCIAEDTIETQAGVAFFGFFMALFSKPRP